MYTAATGRTLRWMIWHKPARMNRGQFCRIFRSLLRMILVQYLNGYRIRHSGRLLEEIEKKSVL